MQKRSIFCTVQGGYAQHQHIHFVTLEAMLEGKPCLLVACGRRNVKTMQVTKISAGHAAVCTLSSAFFSCPDRPLVASGLVASSVYSNKAATCTHGFCVCAVQVCCLSEYISCICSPSRLKCVRHCGGGAASDHSAWGRLSYHTTLGCLATILGNKRQQTAHFGQGS